MWWPNPPRHVLAATRLISPAHCLTFNHESRVRARLTNDIRLLARKISTSILAIAKGGRILILATFGSLKVAFENTLSPSPAENKTTNLRAPGD
jgi:hypothetical protein